MKAKQVIVMLLAMISFMCFGLSFNKIEAAEEVYKEAKFGADYNSLGVSSYGASFIATNAGFTVNVVNANNNTNQWSYIKFGHKTTAYVGTVTTAAPIDKAISKVEINIGAINESYINCINSVKLYVSSDATFDSTDTVYSVTIASGKQTITITTPIINAYYRVEVNTSKTENTISTTDKGQNGILQIDGIKFYADIATVTKPALSQDEFSNTNILKSLSFTYDERLSSNLELNVSEMWAANSTITSGYVSSASFGGITLSSPAKEDGTATNAIRHWNTNDNVKQLRLYKNFSITLSTNAPIKSVEFIGLASGMSISTSGYSFSNKTKTISLDADATAVNSITFTVTSNFELTAINVVTKAQVDSSLPKYKNFTNVTLSLKSTFDPANYSNELYYSNGIIVSTSATVATDYATVLPTNGTFDGNRYVVSGTTGDTAQADYVLNLAMSSLAKCNDTLYVYSYVSSMDSEANNFIYYTSVKTYSVTSIIDEYLALTGDQELSADMKELLTALKDAINAASTPAA